jgi:hypothetical protein
MICSRWRWTCCRVRLVEDGLIKTRGRQRTDATQVLASVRDLNRLEMVGETLRAAWEALAVAAPAWLAGHIDAEMVARYAARVDQWRLPAEQSKRRAFGAQIGADGWRILQAMNGPAIVDLASARARRRKVLNGLINEYAQTA